MTGVGRFGREMSLFVAALAATTAIASTDCHVFDRVHDCHTNADCPLGQACDLDGQFCETKAKIVFGALLPDDNVSRTVGKSLATSLDLVTSIVNESGGLLGRPMAFKILPDRPNEVTVRSMRTFIDDERVTGIVGCTNSSVALLMQQIASPAKVLNISAEATSPLLSTAEPPVDRYFFRTTATSRHGEALAAALFSRSGNPPLCKTTFVIDDGSAFGQAYRDAYRETFTKGGGCVVAQVTVPSSVQSSYASVISQLVAVKPDCLLFAVFADVGAELAREGSRDAASFTPNAAALNLARAAVVSTASRAGSRSRSNTS